MHYDKTWLDSVITELRTTRMTAPRINVRNAAEQEARELLDLFAGRMTEEQARAFFKLVTRDWQDGVDRQDRFAMAYTGVIVHQLVSDMDRFNDWTERLWTADDVSATLEAFWESPLLGAGTSYPTLLLYLRDPVAYNIWLGALQDGMAMVGFSKPPGGKVNQYLAYNEAVSEMRVRHGVQAAETDILLINLSRVLHGMADELETALRDLGLTTSKTAIVKRMRPEYGLSFDLSIDTSGVPIRWLAGSRRRNGNTFLLHALVGLQPSDRPALKGKLRERGFDTWLSDGDDPASNPDFLDYHLLSGGRTPFHASLGEVSFTEFTSRRIRERLQPLLQALRELAAPGAATPAELADPDVVEPEPEVSAEPEELYTLASAATDTYLPVTYLQELVDLMEATRRRQLVLYGPPGTGKTFVAKALARALTGGGTGVEIIQFHPSYSYEEFMEGLRPQVTEGGELTYKVQAGIFKELCRKADANRAQAFVLIIDEINRGNIPRIFGELLYLLEYRDESVKLPYSKEELRIPANLFVIGTMNTADRSIALVDAALRRRFHFVPFFPDTKAGILREWLLDNRKSMLFVADMVERVNRQIGDRASFIGHSFFMDKELDEQKLRLIWTYNIMPLLEETFFDQPEKLRACDFDTLLRACLYEN